jgi:excisionase family DNA binding protein
MKNNILIDQLHDQIIDQLHDHIYNSQLLTTLEACIELKLSKDTIYRYINSGKLNAVKIGNQYRIKRSELQNLIQ